MKKSQEYVLIVGLILFLIISLFPPYTGIYQDKGEKRLVDMGYHFLFLKPVPKEVYTTIFDDSFYYPGKGKQTEHIISSGSDKCCVSINYKLYLFQYFSLLNITVGLFVLFKYRK